MGNFKKYLIESKDKDHHWYYHVTPTRNVPNIKKEGLKPSIGERSKKIGEDKPRTYLFKHRDAAEDAVTNWMGDEHPEDEKLSLLKVKVHKDHVQHTPGAEYEHSTEHHIPPHHIKVETEDF